MQNLLQPVKERSPHWEPAEASESSSLSMRRAKECFGLMMIGDGLLGVLEPTRHVALWLRGPELWQDFVAPFAGRPQLTRCVGAAELLAGLWLASRQRP